MKSIVYGEKQGELVGREIEKRMLICKSKTQARMIFWFYFSVSIGTLFAW